MNSNTDANNFEYDEHKYIVFELGGESYATKLTDIREVVERLPVKTIPNTISSFIGVCNLRGQVIGAIDLRKRFTLQESGNAKEVMLVSETATGAIGCVVDQIHSVSVMLPEDIERTPHIIADIPMKYLHGIGKLNGRLVTILKLNAILSDEELTSIESSRITIKTA